MAGTLNIFIIGHVQRVRESQTELMEEKFKVCPHDMQPGKEMVEYWRRGKFVAGIYPHQDGICIVSKYMTSVAKDPRYPQAAIIKLEGC